MLLPCLGDQSVLNPDWVQKGLWSHFFPILCPSQTWWSSLTCLIKAMSALHPKDSHPGTGSSCATNLLEDLPCFFLERIWSPPNECTKNEGTVSVTDYYLIDFLLAVCRLLQSSGIVFSRSCRGRPNPASKQHGAVRINSWKIARPEDKWEQITNLQTNHNNVL